jgi:alkanesulfonate monooxygenase SsuD/methylene tetrahydromethanopterin reductase-like flavin-dependent oxidoreductase (luciferase family)
LDPFLHGPAVAELAAAEIEQFYTLGIATPAEQQFFDQALNNYRAITQECAGTTRQFQQHIQDIETKYHPNALGGFERLWPEIHQCL